MDPMFRLLTPHTQDITFKPQDLETKFGILLNYGVRLTCIYVSLIFMCIMYD
jgi:hypothetical protein